MTVVVVHGTETVTRVHWEMLDAKKAEIIYNTFVTMIDDDLLQIQNVGGLSICAHDECPVLAINAQDDTSRKIIPIELFCASNILLYDISLGKEVSAGWWFTYCKLMK